MLHKPKQNHWKEEKLLHLPGKCERAKESENIMTSLPKSSYGYENFQTKNEMKWIRKRRKVEKKAALSQD